MQFVGAASYRENAILEHADRGKMPLPHKRNSMGLGLNRQENKVADIIETVNGSVVQHGHHNDRVYVMHLNLRDVPGTLATLEALATVKGYGKIFARIPLDAWPDFEKSGYRTEATIPGLFQGRTDGLFVARYFSSRRQELPPPANMDLLQSIIEKRPPVAKTDSDRTPWQVTKCEPADTTAMGALYRQVFESYPFPILDPGYLEQVMGEDVLYYAVQADGGIAALAAAEIDRKNKAAEMTDFATLPEWRKHGLAGRLLKQLENETRTLEVKTAYTIARATSPGINSLFKNNGYQYAGLLLNNSHICGSIQSMTVWYKTL